MTLEVLLSCMNQNDFSIIDFSNLIGVKTLVVNQCDVSNNEMFEKDGLYRIINSPERGLSRSRNMALNNSSSEICVIADDDEFFEKDVQKIINASYESIPEADIIIFLIKGIPNKFGNNVRKLCYFELLRVSSIQISFRRNSVEGIEFDHNLGAGTKFGGGEENKFLIDCIRNGLKIFFVPYYIAQLKESNSTWFHGFDDEYFYNKGNVIRYVMGFSWGSLYLLYFVFSKREIYKSEFSTYNVFFRMLKGFFDNRIAKSLLR